MEPSLRPMVIDAPGVAAVLLAAAMGIPVRVPYLQMLDPILLSAVKNTFKGFCAGA